MEGRKFRIEKGVFNCLVVIVCVYVNWFVGLFGCKVVGCF